MTDLTKSLSRMQSKAQERKAEKLRQRATLWAEIQASDPVLADFLREAHEVFDTSLIRYKGRKINL